MDNTHKPWVTLRGLQVTLGITIWTQWILNRGRRLEVKESDLVSVGMNKSNKHFPVKVKGTNGCTGECGEQKLPCSISSVMGEHKSTALALSTEE